MITVQPIPDTRLVTELGGDIAVVRVPDGPVLAYLTTFEVEQDGTFVRGWSGCWPRAGETISSPYLAPTFDEMVSHVVFLLKQIRPEVVGVTPYEAGGTQWVSQGSRGRPAVVEECSVSELVPGWFVLRYQFADGPCEWETITLDKAGRAPYTITKRLA
jgi:hypothetical protein